MRFILTLTLLMILNPIFAQADLQSAMNSLLEYYNSETLKTKPLSKINWTSSKGKILNRAIDKGIAQQVLHADYKYYANIYPGEIIIKNENIIGLNYILICGAGGFCEYEKLVILKNNGEFITEYEYGKYLSDLSGSLIKENVFVSDSILIFKTSHIKRNPKLDSISSIKIEMQTILISDEEEIEVVARNYFENKKWYDSRFENVNESLSIIERINIEKILQHENNEIYWKKYSQDVINYSNKQDSIRYEIQYPSNWYVKIDSFSTKYNTNILLIENIKEKVIVAGGGPFTEHGSFFKIAVLFTSRGKTIEEFIMNGDLPVRVKKQRLEQVKEMKIGEINNSVWIGTAWASHGYEFIFDGRRFRISCMSGSKEQYKIDLPIFQKMVESFKIIE